MSISPVHGEKEGDIICIFCFIEISKDEEKNTNNFGCECKVPYHQSCLNGWLEKQNNCPICRVNHNQVEEVVETTQIELSRVNNKLNCILTFMSGCCLLIILLIVLYLIQLNPEKMESISNNTEINNINYNI